MTVAIGNLVVVFVAESKMVSNQVHEYIIFVVLLSVATVAFIIIGYFYKYENDDDDSRHDKEEDNKSAIVKNKRTSVNKINPLVDISVQDIQLIRMKSFNE